MRKRLLALIAAALLGAGLPAPSARAEDSGSDTYASIGIAAAIVIILGIVAWQVDRPGAMVEKEENPFPPLACEEPDELDLAFYSPPVSEGEEPGAGLALVASF